MWKSFLLYFVCLLSTGEGCIQVLDGWKQVGLEERAKRAPIVFHGLAIETLPSNEDSFSYSVQFWLINVYKGSESVGKFLDLDPGSGGVFNLRDRSSSSGLGNKKVHRAVVNINSWGVHQQPGGQDQYNLAMSNRMYTAGEKFETALKEMNKIE